VTLCNLAFQSTLVDPNVWICKAAKENGVRYYEPNLILHIISNIYQLKENSFVNPTMYLGTVIKEHTLPDETSKTLWSMSADKYVKEEIRTMEQNLLELNMKLPSNVHMPLVTSYRPFQHCWMMII
jgi:hypothetical protein